MPEVNEKEVKKYNLSPVVCTGKSARTEEELKMLRNIVGALSSNPEESFFEQRKAELKKYLKGKPDKKIYMPGLGEWVERKELAESNAPEDILRVFNDIKNERVGCGQSLNEVLDKFEDENPTGTEGYVKCPKCGNEIFVVSGVETEIDRKLKEETKGEVSEFKQ